MDAKRNKKELPRGHLAELGSLDEGNQIISPILLLLTFVHKKF